MVLFRSYLYLTFLLIGSFSSVTSKRLFHKKYYHHSFPRIILKEIQCLRKVFVIQETFYNNMYEKV